MVQVMLLGIHLGLDRWNQQANQRKGGQNRTHRGKERPGIPPGCGLQSVESQAQLWQWLRQGEWQQRRAGEAQPGAEPNSDQPNACLSETMPNTKNNPPLRR